MKSKEELIAEYLDAPLKPGDPVTVTKDNGKQESAEIKLVLDNGVLVKHDYSTWEDKNLIPLDKINKETYRIGYNPFSDDNYFKKVRFSSYSIDGVMGMCGFNLKTLQFEEKYDSPELDWNPYVLDKNGNKIHYQRGFVWSIKNKQLLIETIYSHGNIGTFIFRKNNASDIFKKQEKGLEHRCFYDIIDGKQRLNAIIDFMSGKFPDLAGRYYKDFSLLSKRIMENFSGMATGTVEETNDEDVLKIFLRVNFTGKQMSQDHIDFVKSINLK